MFHHKSVEFHFPELADHRLNLKLIRIATANPVKKVALAGASGFVGTALRESLGDKYEWIGLTRSASTVKADTNCTTDWRSCDLFSLPQVREALKGADIAIYLVHSMIQTSRLVQGNFRDLDLLLADNFIRAAEEAGIKRVIYLGGLIPSSEDGSHLSRHLASRQEVEQVLGSRGIPVTVLRAGLILGPGGSSAQLLLNLVHRLPIMILPAWTRNISQSIDIRDIVRAMDFCLESDDYIGSFDIAGHEAMTYREIILRTGKMVRKNTYSISVPTNAIRLSRLWVSLFGSTPAYLVNPLVDSLRHNLSAKPNPLLDRIMDGSISFEESVKNSIDSSGQALPHPMRRFRLSEKRKTHREKRVRSIQRLPLPDQWPAHVLTKLYANWIRRITLGLVREVHTSDGKLDLCLISPGRALIEMNLTPFSSDCQYRRAYYITGGMLVKNVEPPGRFEVRIFPKMGILVTALHGYKPRLPWWLYSISQALIHVIVMHAFGRFLGRIRARLIEKSR
ncbi:MAG: NAD-dependent epimerase/dehydratase family protein [Puniceicoccaceae bacterium]